jgi:hypothetical protein
MRPPSSTRATVKSNLDFSILSGNLPKDRLILLFRLRFCNCFALRQNSILLVLVLDFDLILVFKQFSLFLFFFFCAVFFLGLVWPRASWTHRGVVEGTALRLRRLLVFWLLLLVEPAGA